MSTKRWYVWTFTVSNYVTVKEFESKALALKYANGLHGCSWKIIEGKIIQASAGKW